LAMEKWAERALDGKSNMITPFDLSFFFLL
jgi:hypothetical protein